MIAALICLAVIGLALTLAAGVVDNVGATATFAQLALNLRYSVTPLDVAKTTVAVFVAVTLLIVSGSARILTFLLGALCIVTGEGAEKITFHLIDPTPKGEIEK